MLVQKVSPSFSHLYFFRELIKCNLLLEAAPWDDINFRFYFRTEVVYPWYPTDHVFIFFRIFIFL